MSLYHLKRITICTVTLDTVVVETTSEHHTMLPRGRTENFSNKLKKLFFHTFSSSNPNSSKQQSQNWIKLTMAVSCLVWITFIKTLWSSLKYTVLTCGEIIGVLTMSLIWESLLPLSVWEVRAWSGALESLIDGACLVNRPNHETSAVNGDVADGYRCTPIGSPAHY